MWAAVTLCAAACFCFAAATSDPQESRASDLQRHSLCESLQLRERTLERASWSWRAEEKTSAGTTEVRRGLVAIHGEDVLRRTFLRDGEFFRDHILTPNGDWGVDCRLEDGRIFGVVKRRPAPRHLKGANFDTVELFGLKVRISEEPLSTLVDRTTTELFDSRAGLIARFAVKNSQGRDVPHIYEFERDQPYRLKEFQIAGKNGWDFAQMETFGHVQGVWHPLRCSMGHKSSGQGNITRIVHLTIGDVKLDSEPISVGKLEAALRDTEVDSENEFTGARRTAKSKLKKMKEDADASAKQAQDELRKALSSPTESGVDARPASGVGWPYWIAAFLASAVLFATMMVIQRRG
jgi:ElaB/YqjD/DUF883 family membrane-anchored ribosome-binding protein